MEVSEQLRAIYDEEMRERIEQLRVALALAGAVDVKARERALYDAHLQAHTMKGTSHQLGFTEASQLAQAMCEVLERAREARQLERPAAERIDKACTSLLAWLDQGDRLKTSLLIAAAGFALEESA